MISKFEVLDLNRAVAAYLTTGDWQTYSEHRERALKSEWGRIAAGFPGTPDQPIWTFLRGVAAYDPCHIGSNSQNLY